MKRYLILTPGLLLCLFLGGGAFLLAPRIPFLGAPVLALILGILAGNLPGFTSRFSPGAGWSDRNLLPLAIALLGGELNLPVLAGLGIPMLLLIFLSVSVSLSVAWLAGKVFRLPGKTALLLGAGNGICGSSAVVSVSRVIDADENQTGLSLAAVNFMGTLELFLLPLLLVFLGFSPQQTSGVLGGSLQAVGHVVAAGFGISDEVGSLALVVKMGRVLMLGPVVMVAGAVYRRNRKSPEPDRPGRGPFPVPLFIIGFFLMSLLSSYRLLPESILSAADGTGRILLSVAMAAIGMKIQFSSLFKQGPAVLGAELLIALVHALVNTAFVSLFLAG